MTIAVIGTGSVGAILGERWAQKGRDVVFGSRDPGGNSVTEVLRRTGGKARATTVTEAAREARVLVLATPFTAARPVLSSIEDLQDKIVVDCTNPIGPGLSLLHGHDSSGAERVASWSAGAHVVKCFNSTGWENMANPRYGDQAATMFLCGDDAGSKQEVAVLAEALGFEACDAGPLSMARHLEPLAMLWIQLARVEGLGPDIAFKLLRR